MAKEGKKGGRGRHRQSRGVFERSKGSGVWWVRYHDQHGREHRERVGPKGLAAEVYRKRKTEVAERRFFPERVGRRDPLLRDVIDDYLERVRNRLRSFADQARCARLWKEALGGYPLRQIVTGDVQRYVARRLAEVRPASVNREVAFLKRVFNVAMDDDLADANPVRKVRLLREDNARVRYLTDDEESRLRSEIGELQWPVVAIALHTGLRRTEQFSLMWEHVDFNTNVLTIPRTKAGRVRRVPMNSMVRELLRSLPSRLKSPWVFPSASGETPLDSQNLMNRVFVPAVKRADIQDFRWHDLRHTFASRLVMKGVDIRTTQELLGHADIRMTLRYSHLSPSHLLDAVEKLLDATGTTTGTSESEPEQRDVAESGTTRTHRGTRRATRRSRTGDLLITNQLLYLLS